MTACATRVRDLFRRLGIGLLFAAPFTAVDVAQAQRAEPLFAAAESTADRTVVGWTHELVTAAFGRDDVWRVSDFPLPGGLTVELELEPFRVAGPRTRFVLGRAGGPDLPIDFDPQRVWTFRGKVRDHPGSHVFLALSEKSSTGSIDLGPGRPTYRIADHESGGGALTVFRGAQEPTPPPDVPPCSLLGEPALPLAPAAPASIRGGTITPPPVKHIEIAVDSDHEFWQLFGDTDAASTYVVQLYAAISDIYLRDVDAWVELVFVRLWDDPNDLYNDVDPSPLPDFQAEWEGNMGQVDRDVAQLISGRRDYPFGGQAYLASLCGGNGYSVVGYMLGQFPNPTMPSPLTYDIAVTAHELGHNAGTAHTHDSPNFVDTCQNTSSTPQRGTIMSYCAQTWSGGNSNRDLYFHSVIQQNIEGYLVTAACVADDCNFNGIEDSVDVSGGFDDVNGNGVPDVCEDCNGNAVLDDSDIMGGASFDINGNGRPDECDPDCDGDAIPDDEEIATGSSDAYGNDIPDECETDCDDDGLSDYTEIQGAMVLDVDRNAMLDACQDCDGNGTNDLDELAGGHGVWVASGLAGSPVRHFYADTGVLTVTSPGGAAADVQAGRDLIVAPGGRVLVTSGADNRVMEFHLSGSYVGDLVAGAAGRLSSPAGLVLSPPGGELLVANEGKDEVRMYDASSGTPLGSFVNPGSGGLIAPFGLTFGPNGNLFVTSASNEVLEYDGMTGSFLSAFVPAATNGGLDQPRGLVFKPDGNLLVASFGSNEVLEYEAGTGAPLGKWAQVGTPTRLTQVSPWGIRVGPNGNVFVVRTGEDYGSNQSAGDENDDDTDDTLQSRTDFLHLTNAQVYEFDVRTGNFLRTHIGGNDHGLLFPTGFDFVPGWADDCNFNLIQDSCDISQGASQDQDGNGMPDECDVDCNANGTLDRLDIIPFGASLDTNYNLRPDECDCFTAAECDDGLSCTTDSCDTGSSACENVIVIGSCRIDDACYNDGDENPGNDCEVCDALLPGAWTAAPPVEVQQLTVTQGAGIELSWTGQGTAAVYDVAGGAIGDLAADGGVVNASCLADDVGATTWTDPSADPLPGTGNYYFVRAQKSCGDGSYGFATSGTERLPSAACP